MCRLLIIICLLLFAIGARAQSNLFLFNSPSGEYIGQGASYYSTNTADFSVGFYGGVPQAVVVSAYGFFMYFSGTNGTLPFVGIYTNTGNFPEAGSSGAMRISGNGRGCQAICGSFRVYEFHTSAGVIDRFWVTFTQRCECGPPLTGEIRFGSLLAPATPLPRTLRVPVEYPTIQSALDNVNSSALDRVLVDPGFYPEALQIGNKRAQLLSANGPAATYLTATGSTAITIGGTTADTLISGFTIMGSDNGIYIHDGGSPNIVSNAIVNCGTGIYVGSGSAIVRSNTITGCVGAAVQMYFTGRPVLEGNLMEDNGGGIGMWQAGNPLIRNNVIRRNHGDAMWMANYSDADVIQNLIVENEGNGFSWGVVDGARGPWLINNTILRNGGAGIQAGGFSGNVQIVNNIVVGSPAITSSAPYPTVRFNDMYSPSGPAYLGITNLTGIDGNISVDPFLVCQPGDDYRLSLASACIDGGTNGADFLPATDFSGDLRIRAGHTNSPAAVDMGAFELNLAAPPPSPCPFLYCPANRVAIAPVGQNSTIVTYPSPYATPGATVTNSPPSGSAFPAGTNIVTSTAVIGTNVLTCTFTVAVLVPPTIVTQWQGAIVTSGRPTTLAVAASGTGPLRYQWSFEGIPIASATNSAFTLTNPQSGDQGFYRVIVTNGVGAVFSSPAFLRVLPAGPSTLSGPNSTTVAAGSNVTFAITTTGSAPFAYQWYHDTSPIPGATLSQLIVSNAQTSAVGGYYVEVSNSLGVATSSNATLNVLPAKPTFVLQPSGGFFLYGSNATLRVLATGTDPISYQWRLGGANLPGATQTSLVLSNLTPANTGSYSVVATNVIGGTTSQVTAVTVQGTPPRFTQQPGSVEVLEGSTVTLNSLATSTLAISYQWFFYGTNLPAKTNRQLILSNITVADSGPYFVTASNLLGTTNSITVQVTVNQSVILNQTLTNQVVDSGNTVTFAVSATETNQAPLNYEWTLDGISLGVTGPVLILTNVQPADSGYYTVSASNPYGSRTSTARLSVFGPSASVIAWGDNSGGQTNVPAGLDDAVAVTGGDYHSLILRHNGTLKAFGYNGNGQTNVPVNSLRFVSITAGANHNLAVTEDGSLVAWGRNDAGQCNVPVAAQSVRVVAAGDSHSLALMGPGTVLAWGDNTFGQTNIPGGMGILRSVVAGRNHNVALGANGTMRGWGLNTYGQASAPGLSDVRSIAAGYLHSVALRSNGTVVVWGDNTFGQTSVPSDATNIVAISAGDYHTLALRGDGKIFAWGNNWFGQIPIPAGAVNVLGIGSGYYHNLALSWLALLHANRTPDGLIIEWNGGGVLQGASTIGGPYSDIPSTSNPYTNSDFSSPAKFFRVRR